MNTFFAEFAHSAILWGSVVTSLLWWLRRRGTRRIDRWILTPLLLWFAIHTAIAWYGLFVPPMGRLVDAESGQPLANERVVVSWISYPMAIWTTHCSGRQAHLTDAEGDFSFPLAPYPTLLVGTFARGITPHVPGRLNHRKLSRLLMPVWGDVRIERYRHDLNLSASGPNTGCHEQFASQYPDNLVLLPGEAHPFARMFQEACIAQQPWTLVDAYMKDMMLRRPDRNQSSKAPPTEVQSALRELGAHGCASGEGGACAKSIDPAVRTVFCDYFKTIAPSKGSHI